MKYNALLDRRSLRISLKSQKEAILISSFSGSVPRLVGTGINDEEGSSSGERNKDAVPASRVGTVALHAAGQKTCDNDGFRPCRLRCNLDRSLTIWKPQRDV